MATAAEPAAPPQPSLFELFMGFLAIALSGFGGTLVFAHHIMVERRRWLTDRDFTETLSLCQFLPGPNIVNMSIRVGARFHGPIGAVVAFLGLILTPFAIVVSLAALYDRFGQVTLVKDVLAGLSPAAAGLTLALGVKMAVAFRRTPWALGFMALAFIAIALLGWPLAAVVLLLAPFSVAVAWWRL